MKKRISAMAAVMVAILSVFGFSGCRDENPREEVISYINKLDKEKELKFIIKHSDIIHIAVQKYDGNGKLVYMYNKHVQSETGEVIDERLYQNEKDFDLIKKTYYEVVLTGNASLGGKLPDILLLELESTTFEKISSNEYFVTVYPQTILGDMFGDMVLEYTIKTEKDFVSEIRFAGYITAVSRDIGELVIIDESEFTNRNG